MVIKVCCSKSSESSNTFLFLSFHWESVSNSKLGNTANTSRIHKMRSSVS